MDTLNEKPKWKTIGQYRNVPLPIRAVPPPIKHMEYAKYLGLDRKSIFPKNIVNNSIPAYDILSKR